MLPCPHMDQVELLAGSRLTPAERAWLEAHVRECDRCRAQIARIAWLAHALAVTPLVEPDPDTPHPADLDVAAFATHSLSDEDATPFHAHLARCTECTRLVVAVRRALDDHEALFGPTTPPEPAADWRSRARSAVGRAYSTRLGTALATAAVIAYLGGCALFAVALAYLLYAFVPLPPHYQAIPSCWPLSLVAAGPARLIALVLACAAGASALHLLARLAWRSALRRGRPTEGEDSDGA